MILYSIFCKKIYKLSSTGPFSNLKKLVENIIIFLKNPVLQDSPSAAGGGGGREKIWPPGQKFFFYEKKKNFKRKSKGISYKDDVGVK